MKIYGDTKSGNCLKVKWTAEFLGIPYSWIETDIMVGQSRTAEFLAMNPAGQVPAVILPDGRPLAQSNAIILHLAEGSDLVPADAYDRARMYEWMYWEQYSHEPYVAVAASRCLPGRASRTWAAAGGGAALQRLEDGLADGPSWRRRSACRRGPVAYTRGRRRGLAQGYPNVWPGSAGGTGVGIAA